jgi:hypothetical protein
MPRAILLDPNRQPTVLLSVFHVERPMTSKHSPSAVVAQLSRSEPQAARPVLLEEHRGGQLLEQHDGRLRGGGGAGRPICGMEAGPLSQWLHKGMCQSAREREPQGDPFSTPNHTRLLQ